MIYRLYSTLPKFKEIIFHPGLNILLADKGPNATDRHTRNSAGKTSLIEMVHFLMGAKCDKDSIFRAEALLNESFGIEFSLDQTVTKVQRSGKTAGKLEVLKKSEDWPVEPKYDKKKKMYTISNSKWKEILGYYMFGLTEQQVDDEELHPNSGPTFRSLFSYFVRREGAGGFSSPFYNSTKQQLGDSQLAITFLLGLDWSIPYQWQLVRERERTLRELKKAAGQGMFGEVIGTMAELRTRLVIAQEKARRLKENISNFKVLAEYKELEKEASELTRKILQLTDENVSDRNIIRDLEESLVTETVPSYTELEKLYTEAGVILPENVTKRFEDVKIFHEKVIQNRRSYLLSEISLAEQRITERDRAKEKLSDRKAEIMMILNSHGALEEFLNLQSELTKVEAEKEALHQQYVTAEQLEKGKTELEIDRKRLEMRLKQDYSEQADVLNRAIVLFEQISSALYENAGSLVIDASSNGPLFDIKIPGSRSTGINNMQIFCFDMMLMRLCRERGMGPDFLIHDSHLFDGVDERQIAKALSLGAQLAHEYHFQYIVTMNSDTIPSIFPDGFNFDDYVLPIRLTDETEEGGLFGIRF